MAKKGNTLLIQLVSSAGTGFKYIRKKNPRKQTGNTGKWAFRKYDPIVRKHVLFEEKKMPSPKKN